MNKMMILICLGTLLISGCAGHTYSLHKKGSKEHHEYCPGDVLVFIDKYGTQHICEAV